MARIYISYAEVYRVTLAGTRDAPRRHCPAGGMVSAPAEVIGG
jgi:hypothetical protein